MADFFDFLNTQADSTNQQRQQQLNQLGGQALQGYGNETVGLGQSQQFLQGLASGQNSISQEQLRQNLGKQLAQQQAMAAGANPANQAMAARNAAMNMGQASYGMSGQQALAGLQERQQAQQALMQMLLQQRGQDIGAAQGAFQTQAPQTFGTQMGYGALAGAAGAAPQLFSDRRLKRDVVAEDDDAKKSRQVLANLKPYSYTYKDERMGKGEQYGVMAQDMEKAGLGHAVIDTPYGKMVHAGKAATSALALSAALARRIDALETEREGRGRRSRTEEDDE